MPTTPPLIAPSYVGPGEADSDLFNDEIVDQIRRLQLRSVASASAPVSPTAGDYWYDTTNKRLWVHDGTNWTRVTGSEAATAGSTNLTTAYVALASVTLPVGRWTVLGKGWFNWAGLASAGEQLDAELWDGTTQRDLATASAQTVQGQEAFSLLWTVTLAAATTVSARVKTSGIDGTQKVENLKLSAIPG
jgi:hypothetical protein